MYINLVDITAVLNDAIDANGHVLLKDQPVIKRKHYIFLNKAFKAFYYCGKLIKMGMA